MPIFLLVPSTAASSLPFNPNDLIDDITFNNTTTMSAAYIDSWLNNNFSNSCISSNANSNGNAGFTTPSPDGWDSATNQYNFGSNVTAGQAIYNVSQEYNVNPQVILTTLQKEQGVVSGGAGCYYNTPNPAAPFSSTPSPSNTFTCDIGGQSTICTYACTTGGGCMPIAMSYACPGYCSAGAEGFSLQLEEGAWLLRFGQERSQGILSGYTGYDPGDENYNYTGPMTQGYRQSIAGGPSIYYDGTYTTQDGVDVTIDNGATASLYYYTPFESGNLLFDNLFQGTISNGDLGFGSVYSNNTFTPHPNGTLISNGSQIFLINNQQRDWITNPYVFESYGYQWNTVVPATIGDTELPAGPNIDTLAPGTIFYSTGTPVYVMNYIGGVLEKQQISLSSYNGLGYKWSQVMYVPPDFVPSATAPNIYFSDQHPPGTLVADYSTGKVYLLTQTSKDWVLGPDAFNTNSYSWSNVLPATAIDLSLPDGSDINLANGTMLLASGNIYLVNYDSNNNIYIQPVGPWDCFSNRLHYGLVNLYSISPASLPSTVGPIFTCSD
ncbi:hypothetical protein M1512_04085 [Patescibacteria group bacterium]|nr:hypothetical protein [Patescibacteria group bacterium]